MGKMFADDLASIVGDMRTSVGIHLTSNCYPPAGAMLEPCIEAIDLANCGMWNAEVELPEGCFYRNESTAPAWILIDNFRLHSWIEVSNEEA